MVRSKNRPVAWYRRPWLSSGVWRSRRAHSMGVKDSEITAEISIDTAMVMANSWNSRPTTSPMNRSGISTAISEMVSEMMVKPICLAPLSAAASGGSPAST
ncbi:acetyl-coenzyme A transporter 1 [Alicycliphilus sp. B1]|nr:acetyl-coenzyme A transporter 1 [Alicycliphilus sp. B1]